MEAAVRALPKIVPPTQELHAHLHGCIRQSTLSELLLANGKPSCPPHWKTMADAFQVFALTHSVVTTPEIVYRVTKEVIEDFQREGTVYLELRTVTPMQTPRDTAEMTKRDYLASVLRALAETDDRIIVRLVLSVNRAQGVDAANDALSLAGISPLIVGMDFSGNPSIGTFAEYREVFERARAAGLKTTVHMGETTDTRELADIVAFRPERIGHCCYLDSPTEAALLAAPIPMEVCLSSNLGTMQLQSVREHHFQRFFAAKYPLVICTDDTAVFETTITKEYLMLVEHLGMTVEELGKLAETAAEFVFDSSPEVREKLRKAFATETESRTNP